MGEIMKERERIKDLAIVDDILPFEKFIILITGVGISGKSTFRRAVFDYLKNEGENVEHYDADNFKEIRHPLERLCLKKLPKKFEDKIYLIEDIHAPLSNEAIMPLSDYDKIFYLCPDLKSHSIFWFQRMFKWYEHGNFSWESDKGWSGTGKKRDLENLEGIVNAYLHDMKNKEKWIKEDLNVISKFPYKLIKSVWTKGGPVFYQDANRTNTF